jgi:hypothetical protein
LTTQRQRQTELNRSKAKPEQLRFFATRSNAVFVQAPFSFVPDDPAFRLHVPGPLLPGERTAQHPSHGPVFASSIEYVLHNMQDIPAQMGTMRINAASR